MNDRLKSNLKIIEILTDLANQNPDWRFHQLLQNLEVESVGEDRFYEESNMTLKLLENNIKNLKKEK
jgi:hypothetical protein